MSITQVQHGLKQLLFRSVLRGRLVLLLSIMASGAEASGNGTPGPRSEPVDLTLYEQVSYVAPAGEDEPDRGSRDHPYRILGFAVAQSQGASEKSRAAILVAAGTYIVNDLKLSSWVDLYGGFDSENRVRQIAANKTILDADGKGRVLVGADQCRVDGFTLQGGRPRGHGGAILCKDAGMVITNNVFMNNGTLEPTGYNRQHLHERGHTGGAIAMSFSSTCEIAHNLFVENFTEIGEGGAISCYQLSRSPRGKSVIRENAFLGNRTGASVMPFPMTRASSGGAISCSHGSAPNILRNAFIGNQAGDNSDAGAIYMEVASSPLVQGNWIVGNQGYDDGGGIYCMRDAQPTIESNWIAGNQCVRGGPGGIRLSKEGRAIIRNNFIVHNQKGGGVINANGWMRMENNTIVNNGQLGVYHHNSLEHFNPSVLSRNIIRGNTVQIDEGGLRPVVSYNNVEGGYDGEGNTDADPQFVEDGIEQAVSQIEYDPESFTTWIACEPTLAADSHLQGRILQYGKRWSVVKLSDGQSIVVWGDVTRQLGGNANVSDAIRIIPTFRLKENSPQRDMGAR